MSGARSTPAPSKRTFDPSVTTLAGAAAPGDRGEVESAHAAMNAEAQNSAPVAIPGEQKPVRVRTTFIGFILQRKHVVFD
jgi:hypothetical protein